MDWQILQWRDWNQCQPTHPISSRTKTLFGRKDGVKKKKIFFIFCFYFFIFSFFLIFIFKKVFFMLQWLLQWFSKNIFWDWNKILFLSISKVSHSKQKVECQWTSKKEKIKIFLFFHSLFLNLLTPLNFKLLSVILTSTPTFFFFPNSSLLSFVTFFYKIANKIFV